MSDTVRVNMIWPKDLKERINEIAGPRGLTEYTIKAVELHLNGGASQLEDELNQVKHLTQLLADRIVMGGSNVDRLEAFMELELPSWLDTSGWPSEMAKRVPSESPAQDIDHSVEIPPAVVDTPGPVDVEESMDAPTDWINDPETTAEEKVEHFEELKPEPTSPPPSVPVAPSGEELPEDFFEKKVAGGDLFARIMEKTGGDPLMNELKPASEIAPPPKDDNVCPNCGDELVDGECWTCG